MAERTLPGLGLTGFWDLHADNWKPGMDENLRVISAVSQMAVISRTTALPGSASNGDMYIVPSGDPTNGNKVAVRDNSGWVYLTPKVGWEAWVTDVPEKVRFTSGGWSVVAGSGGGTTQKLEADFTAPPVASTWTQQNFHVSNTSLADFTTPVAGVRIAEAVNAYGNVNNLRAAMRAVPGANWDVKARLRRHTRVDGWHAYGLVVRDSASGRSSIIGFNYEASGIGAINFTNDTTYASFTNLGGNRYPWQPDIWIRLVYNGTDCLFYTSKDGAYWALAKQWTATALWGHLTNAATHIGFGYNANNALAGDLGNEVDLLSWQAVAL